jgi:formamidopyrimidine-DNA glycosylase
MPELPEVEIVRQSLDKKIKQKRVKKVIIRNRNLRFLLPNNFKSSIKNKKITKVERFSKYLIIRFLEGAYCLVHLGMSGTIHIIDKFNLSKFTNTSFYHSPILPKKPKRRGSLYITLKLSNSSSI